MIILNREVKFRLPKSKLLLPIFGLVVLIVLGLAGVFIAQRLANSQDSVARGHASESSESAEIGSHNECDGFACIARPGIGASDCSTNLDCQTAECSTVSVDPTSPKVGDTNTKFICQGQAVGSSNASAVYFQVIPPGSTAPLEIACPSDTCQMVPQGASFTATLNYAEPLVKGSYKVLTKTCFKLFSGKEICGDYKQPVS